MNRFFFSMGLSLAMIPPAAKPARALDRVERKSTSPAAQGEIVSVSKTGITLQSPGKPPEEIPANDIAGVRWDGEPARLNLLRNDEANGRYDRALDGYRQTLAEIGAGKRNLKTDVEYLIARTLAKMALSDAAKRSDALSSLEAFRSANPNFFRYYEALDYLGRLYLLEGDQAKANTVYQLLSDAPWPEYKSAGQLSKAELLLSQGNVDDALAAFDSVIDATADDPAARPRKWEAMLGKAACLHQKDQHPQAAQLLQKLIDEAPADDARLQARTYLRLGQALETQGNSKEALLAYLHVDVLFTKQDASRSESLFHLARLWASVGHPDRAADASTRLKQEYPDTEWAQKVSAN